VPGLGAGITSPTRTILIRGVKFPQPGVATIAQGLPALTQASTSEVLLEAVIGQTLPLSQAVAAFTDEGATATAVIAQELEFLTQGATSEVILPLSAEIVQALSPLRQRARVVRFNDGGGVEGFEVGYGPMGQGINRRRKDFATSKGRAVS